MQIRYPKEQMHRIRYTKLTEQQILDKLAAVGGTGPTSASPLEDLSEHAGGRPVKIVTDGGLVLEYRFNGKNRLSVAENGGAAVDAGYGALMLGDVGLLAHLLPGTQRGYAVVADTNTRLATVFELWFNGYDDKREVQRQIHYGYLERPGQEPPQARHTLTNRLEGKGFYWKQDTGAETLELFHTAEYSNFVELTRLGGELGFCGPSDYVRIDDDRYVYSRVECEFSGTMTLYVLDVNRAKQIGMRLGFDADDALEYYLFNGTGEMVGQIARFEKFGDYGTTIPQTRPLPNTKGARPVYRPLKTNPIMSKDEVEAAIAKSTTVFAERNAMAGNKLPVSELLVGKELTLRYDDGGPAVSYEFDDAHKLRWRREGEGSWHEERYEAWESAPGVVMFGHLLSGAPRHDSFAVVVDFDNALTSCVNGTLGTPYMANEASRKTWFGVVETAGLTPPKYLRHRFTYDLVGHALTWEYSPGLTSMHVYTTPYSFSWVIFLESGAGGLAWSGPAQYVKIRDGLYLFNWLEEACNGTLGTLLINTKTMHDCGVGYHCGTDGLRLSSIGAIARNAGRFDLMRFYGPKAAV
ncbi:MAG TPA: MoaF N-terminal domain-containing protein [Gammaproteobacteria bacterium]|nr:MoaF N-terminal domain-containing protein [Gammaproteobacteria bacterium]